MRKKDLRSTRCSSVPYCSPVLSDPAGGFAPPLAKARDTDSAWSGTVLHGFPCFPYRCHFHGLLWNGRSKQVNSVEASSEDTKAIEAIVHSNPSDPRHRRCQLYQHLWHCKVRTNRIRETPHRDRQYDLQRHHPEKLKSRSYGSSVRTLLSLM